MYRLVAVATAYTALTKVAWTDQIGEGSSGLIDVLVHVCSGVKVFEDRFFLMVTLEADRIGKWSKNSSHVHVHCRNIMEE